MWLVIALIATTWLVQVSGGRGHFNNVTQLELTTGRDEIEPRMPDENMQTTTIVAGLMSDSLGEMFNFLDGDSFGIVFNGSGCAYRPSANCQFSRRKQLRHPYGNFNITFSSDPKWKHAHFDEMFNCLDGDSFGVGPMHEFVYGWQAIINTMSMKNNVEVRKRAGLQRFALAGINGITLISHIGVTEIMINGTRTYCFGGVSRPPGRRSVICKGAMYQEARFDCRTPYLRFPTVLGYRYCIDKYAAVSSLDGTYKTTYCSRGESIPKFHYDYICERRDVKIRQFNLSDPNEKFNIRNPVVRRAEYYRAPYDILHACPDWYGCNLQIAPDLIHQTLPSCLLESNDTAFVGHGGKYWLALYYTQLSTYAIYFQAHGEYPWQSSRPIVAVDKGGIWEQLLKANIGPDMNLHYNLNGIFNRYPSTAVLPDLIKTDGQVQPSNFRSEARDSEQQIIRGNIPAQEIAENGEPASYKFLHDVQVQGKFEHGKNFS